MTAREHYEMTPPNVILTTLLVRIPIPREKGTDARSSSVPIFAFVFS